MTMSMIWVCCVFVLFVLCFSVDYFCLLVCFVLSFSSILFVYCHICMLLSECSFLPELHNNINSLLLHNKLTTKPIKQNWSKFELLCSELSCSDFSVFHLLCATMCTLQQCIVWYIWDNFTCSADLCQSYRNC